MPEIEALSKNIRAIRNKLNQSQIDFAANCDISTEILSLIERQKTDPRLSTIQKIAAYVGCEVIDLLTKGDDLIETFISTSDRLPDE